MEIVLIFALLVGVMAIIYFTLLRRLRCPSCGRLKVPGHSTCPYCGASYYSTLPGSPLDSLSSATPYLVCVEGPQKGQKFPIHSRQFSIGRSADNILRLQGLLVSRYHALISFQDGQYILYDRESTNGTYVNGHRVAHHVLRSGDRIQIGPSVFVFQTSKEVVSPEVSPPPLPKPTVIPSPSPIPAKVFKNHVLTLIHRGEMADVYKGVSRLDGTTVAIKIFRHTDPYLREKFEQEGRVGQSLQHPHIVRILDFGDADGVLYIIMEYVDNGSLRDRLKVGQPLPLDFVTSVIGQTCEALSYAHSHGVIHRDIKPENIMFSSKEGVKVVDFGIAKVGSTMTHTSEGMILGTPYYMSYEQARGQPDIDPRSDLYSLGVVLYEMVTGRVPFIGEPIEVLRKHLTERPVPPRRINPALPAWVEAVVMRALEKDRNRRFQTAAELARALGYTKSIPSPKPYVYGVPRARLPRVKARPPAPSAQLVIINGARRGKRIALSPPITVLRRRDIDPEDRYISRNHARIILQGEHFWLEDLNSVNGTYLNGHRIFKRALLRSGDRIRIGNNVLRFEEKSQ